MTKLKDRIIESNLTDHVLTDIDLSGLLLNNTPAVLYGLVNKALKKEEVIKLRRGLYLLADKYRHKKISKFFIASRIVPHSYISLESALSYHGWIPEYVATVTSILALGRSKKFVTSLGEFDYYQLPANEYEFLLGIIRVEEIAGEPFFLASPLRALSDYVYIKKVDWQSIDYLINSLRIDREQLLKIDISRIDEIKKIYRSRRVLNFLDKLKQELENND
ncbi:hypothetical protein AYO45_01400 [Gammaproteobacteria bacterium SCGC AG-212-F23]|nr:hypothetical protein AYO45_01400 [Gammaproteobacteria bacterium SCGC AG-212-F23]